MTRLATRIQIGNLRANVAAWLDDERPAWMDNAQWARLDEIGRQAMDDAKRRYNAKSYLDLYPSWIIDAAIDRRFPTVGGCTSDSWNSAGHMCDDSCFPRLDPKAVPA